MNLEIKDFEEIGYFIEDDLVEVVNAALFLNKPILIEGPAGTGKTFLAKSLAQLLKLNLIRLSNLLACSMFEMYSYDCCIVYVRLNFHLHFFFGCLNFLPCMCVIYWHLCCHLCIR